MSRVAGALLLVIVVVMYALYLSRGQRPPGHPWSGISLSLLAFVQFAQSRPQWSRAFIVAIVFAMIAGLAWLLAGVHDL